MRVPVSLFLLCLGLYGSYHAYGIGLWNHGEPGAGLFPFVFSVMLAALIGVDLASQSLGRLDRQVIRTALLNQRLHAYLLATALYAATFSVLGFALSSALAFVLMMRWGERLAWVRVGALTTAAVGLAHVVMQRWLGVPLPGLPF